MGVGQEMPNVPGGGAKLRAQRIGDEYANRSPHSCRKNPFQENRPQVRAGKETGIKYAKKGNVRMNESVKDQTMK
jgi:hypothetical protein